MANSDPGRFAVVAVPFPYADRLAEKKRPALVVAGPESGWRGLVWLAMITSAENAPWPDDIPIADHASWGLPAPSVVRPVKLATVETARIERVLGAADANAIRRVLAFYADRFR